jgi:acyl-CoA thioesterase II
VKRLRDGKSFATRTCDAIQRGRVIFSCMASFHRQDEQSTASFQTSMPVVPPAESLPTQQQRVERMLQDPRLPEALKPVLKKQFSRVGGCRLHLHLRLHLPSPPPPPPPRPRVQALDATPLDNPVLVM